MSMSKVFSSDSSEHSTPLSDNKGRRGTNIIPLLSSVSVLDNADNNTVELSAHQPSPIVSQGLISCFNYSTSSEFVCSCKVPKRPSINQFNQFLLKVHKASVACFSTAKAGPRPGTSSARVTTSPFSWHIGSSWYQSQRLCIRKQLALNSFNTPGSQSRTRCQTP
jgi:hypothetical protein